MNRRTLGPGTSFGGDAEDLPDEEQYRSTTTAETSTTEAPTTTEAGG